MTCPDSGRADCAQWSAPAGLPGIDLRRVPSPV